MSDDKLRLLGNEDVDIYYSIEPDKSVKIYSAKAKELTNMEIECCLGNGYKYHPKGYDFEYEIDSKSTFLFRCGSVDCISPIMLLAIWFCGQGIDRARISNDRRSIIVGVDSMTILSKRFFNELSEDVLAELNKIESSGSLFDYVKERFHDLQCMTEEEAMHTIEIFNYVLNGIRY